LKTENAGANMKKLFRTSLAFAAAALGISAILVTAHGGKTSAGIQGSGFRAALAIGPITVTDPTVSVGGTDYDTSVASILVNGRSASRAQLHVGQIVSVHGGVNAAGNSGLASIINFTADVAGPVTKINGAGQSLEVLGQTVLTTPKTIFGPGASGSGLSGLTTGTNVEVSAFPAADGKLVASRIDVTAHAPEQQVRGPIEQLNVVAHTFRINNLSVDYRDVPLALELGNGVRATVVGVASNDGSELYATQIQMAEAAGLPGEQGRVEGLITAYDSNGAFAVDSLRIVTNSQTHFILHGHSLADNVRVSVQGSFDLTGALVATKVQVQSGDNESGQSR
jgi:hypothetical protein